MLPVRTAHSSSYHKKRGAVPLCTKTPAFEAQCVCSWQNCSAKTLSRRISGRVCDRSHIPTFPHTLSHTFWRAGTDSLSCCICPDISLIELQGVSSLKAAYADKIPSVPSSEEGFMVYNGVFVRSFGPYKLYCILLNQYSKLGNFWWGNFIRRKTNAF